MVHCHSCYASATVLRLCARMLCCRAVYRTQGKPFYTTDSFKFVLFAEFSYELIWFSFPKSKQINHLKQSKRCKYEGIVNVNESQAPHEYPLWFHVEKRVLFSFPFLSFTSFVFDCHSHGHESKTTHSNDFCVACCRIPVSVCTPLMWCVFVILFISIK